MLAHYLVTATGGPRSTSVAQLDDVKTELDISLAVTTYDAKLRRIIRSVGAALAGPQGMQRPPWRQTYVEQTNGDGGYLLLLHRWPVESVSAVTYGTEDPETIDAADYSIAGEQRGALYRLDRWARSSSTDPVGGVTAPEAYDYSATYVGGWLMPDQIADWGATTAKTAGVWVRATSPSSLLRFECTTAGTTGATEPTWPTTVGGTVTDGSVVWTARAASEMPADLQDAVIYGVAQLYRGGTLDLPAGIQSEEDEDHKVQYDFVGLRDGAQFLPPVLRTIARSYR